MLLMLLFFFGKNIKAQDMLGVTLGNYSGVTSLMVNPAMIANTRYYLDINLVSADFFFKNNFAYIPGSDITIYKIIRDPNSIPTYEPRGLNFKYYDNKDLKFTTISSKIMGPSAMFQYGKHAFALSTSFQVFSNANRIPYEMPLLGYYEMDYPELYGVNFKDYDISQTAAAWMDLGLSYAYTLYEYMDQKITIGLTLKYIWSYSGFYVEANNIDYMVVNDSTMNIHNMNASVAFALPLDYNEPDQMMNDPFFKGHGFGADLGVVYVKKKSVDIERWNDLCEQQFDNYVFRIGASILDFGSITYKNNAQLHSYDDVSVYWQNFDTINYSNLNQLMSDLSMVFYNGDPNASYRADHFTLGLPTAVSVQADVNVYKDFYASGYWIHPLQFNLHAMRRAALVAVVPRYETKNLEFSLPVSLFEYKYPRVGLSARFWFVTIGTDRLGTWLGLANLDGMDFYASIKFGFGKGQCHSKFKGACNDEKYTRKSKKLRNKNNLF